MKGGDGQRPFGLFPKKRPLLRRRTFLRYVVPLAMFISLVGHIPDIEGVLWVILKVVDPE